MLLFLDESGTDRCEAPYEVLAGVAVREDALWPLIRAIRNAEREHFGVLLGETGAELKGKKLLKTKVFRLAGQGEPIEPSIRTGLTRSFLEKSGKGENPSRAEFTAYGQAALAFVRELFVLCGQYRVRTFASIVACEAPRPGDDMLRKDYVYLFERFFYYLEDSSPNEMGLIVFDELEKTLCRRLLGRMEDYFLRSKKGRLRSSRIIPEPFFVHSDLTTAVQLADIVAYSLNWGLRLNHMTQKVREEMKPFGQMAFELRYRGERLNPEDMRVHPTYGIKYLDDLRARGERLSEN